MKVIRTGITRTVVLTRRWAIKVPALRGLGYIDSGARIASFCRGFLANRSEIEWSCIDGLNPVVWSFKGLVNVYRRADPPPASMTIDYDHITSDEFTPIGDRKPDNVGFVDGKLVWLDYDYSWNGIGPSATSVE